MKDIHSQMSIVSAIDAAALAADTTPAAIDRQGYEAVELVLAIGIGGITFDGSNKIEFPLTHSDDGSTYDAVADADVKGVSGTSGGILKSLVAAHAAATVSRFGYIGNRRYLKWKADFTGTHGTATPIAAIAILSHAAIQPPADQA